MATLQELQETIVKADAAGNTEDAAALAEAIRQHPTYIKQGEDALKLGFKGLKGKERRRAVQSAAAKALGVRSQEVDVDNGMNLWDRTKLDLLRDDSSRMEYLEKKFGAENVSALDIKGKTKMFYRDPKTNKMTMVDEMGSSLADWTADIAGEAATVAGAVIGAAKGAAIGSSAGPVGTVAGGIFGAAGGHFGVGTALDVGSEIAAGQEVDIGDIVAERGIEAGIGIPIDLATLGAGKFISRGLSGNSARKLIDEFDIAADRVDKMLVREGEKLSIPPALRTGLGSKQASQIAAARPRSKVAKELQATRDNIATIKESLRGRGRFGVSRDEFKVIADKVATNYSKIINEVEAVDKSLAKELKDQASRKIKALSASKISEKKLGQDIRRILSPNIAAIRETNKQNFAVLDLLSKNQKVSIKSIQEAIEDAKKKFVRLKDPESSSIYRDLSKMMKGEKGRPTGILDASGNPILGKGTPGKEVVDFKYFRELMDEINEVISRNKEAGFSTKERVASQVWKNLENLRDEVFDKNETLRSVFKNTIRYYKKNYLGTKRGAVGKTFKEAFGDFSMTDEQVARNVINDPEHIRQVIDTIRKGGQREGFHVKPDQIRKQLQELYLNKIGLIEGSKIPGRGFDFNDDIVAELWGERKLKELKNLRKRIQQSKDVEIENLDPLDVDKYLNALTKEERSNIYRMIRQRQVRGNQLDSLKNSAIIEKLLPRKSDVTGKYLKPEFTGMSLVDFTESFVAAPNSEVRMAMKALKMQNNPIGLQAFRQSYIGNLLKGFRSGAQTDRFGNPLWNPETFAEKMRRGKLRNNALTVLGKDGLDDLLAANRVLLEAAETKGPQVSQLFQPRYSLSPNSLQLYGVGNLIGGLKGNILAFTYGTKFGSAIMRFLTNSGTDAETKAMFKKIIKPLFLSDRVIQAIAIQSQFDPEFKEKIAPLFNAEEVAE